MTDRRVNAYAKGVMGEDRACEYLMQKGMEPLARRFHSPFGEIDLVMRDGETLVFVEVKARERADEESALLAVNGRKQARLIQTARCYLGEHPTNGVVRFDVVAITRDGIRHIVNAFEGTQE